VLAQSEERWHASADGRLHRVRLTVSVPPGPGTLGADLLLHIPVAHPGPYAAPGETGAGEVGEDLLASGETAMARESNGQPAWVLLQTELVAHLRQNSRGQPRTDTPAPTQEWHIVIMATINQEQVEQEAFRKACWMVGTTI